MQNERFLKHTKMSYFCSPNRASELEIYGYPIVPDKPRLKPSSSSKKLRV
jgi:hypothetical protein